MAAAATESTGLAILDTTQSTQIVRGTITLTGTYGPDTLDLSPARTKVQSSRPPIRVAFSEAPTASVTPSGYNFYYQAGTNPNNGKLRITSADQVELTPAAAYSAALLQAVITYEAVFPLGI